MRQSGKRRLTLFDLMVFVAAAGAGFGLARAEARVLGRIYASPATGRVPLAAWLGPVWLVVMAMGLGTSALRLRQPRPRLRRLARQPGCLALIGIAVSVATGLAKAIFVQTGLIYRLGPVGWDQLALNYLIRIASPHDLGPAVVLAWTIGAVQGLRWHRADWIEWLGRVLGAAWIAAWGGLMVSTAFS